MILFSIMRENFAIIKDREVLYKKFAELEAFDESSAVTLNRLGIQEDDEKQTKNILAVKSLYSHLQLLVQTKLINVSGDRYFMDLKKYKRNNYNTIIFIAIVFAYLVFLAYTSYINW